VPTGRPIVTQCVNDIAKLWKGTTKALTFPPPPVRSGRGLPRVHFVELHISHLSQWRFPVYALHFFVTSCLLRTLSCVSASANERKVLAR
jgi:hypothetical protein